MGLGEKAVIFGLIGALVAATVAVSFLAAAVPAMWKGFMAWVDRYVNARISEEQTKVQLAQEKARTAGLEKAVKTKDETIAGLEEDLAKERRHGIQGLDDDDLVDRANAPPGSVRADEGGGGGEARPRPGGAPGGPTVRP